MDFFIIVIIIILVVVIVYWGLCYYRKKFFPKKEEDETIYSQDAIRGDIDRAKSEAYLHTRRTLQGPYGTRRI